MLTISNLRLCGLVEERDNNGFISSFYLLQTKGELTSSRRRVGLSDKKRELEEIIIQVTKDQKPETVQQLIELVKQRLGIPEKQITNAIVDLQNEGRLRLLSRTRQSPHGFGDYLKTSDALWYWIMLILTLTAVTVVFAVPEEAVPIVYIRYVLGSFFVLCLPGYGFTRTLFPVQLPVKTSEKSLDTVERVALSLGLSIALVPLVGLLLNYTPWGIRLAPITLSLAAMTLVFATAGLIREYQAKTVQAA
jgi:hypothetical protein